MVVPKPMVHMFEAKTKILPPIYTLYIRDDWDITIVLKKLLSC